MFKMKNVAKKTLTVAECTIGMVGVITATGILVITNPRRTTEIVKTVFGKEEAC